MARLTWGEASKRLYETGVDRGVFYPTNSDGSYDAGVAWNGLTAVNETPSGGEPSSVMADNKKYLNLPSVEEFVATVEAYTYPKELDACTGRSGPIPGLVIAGQKRRRFGFCYRTILGNATHHEDYGYKLHIVYGILTSPPERNYQTINDSPEAVSFSWEFTATPVAVDGFKPVSHLEIDSTKAGAVKMRELEDILYGTDETAPRLLLPDELIFDPIMTRTGAIITTRTNEIITTRSSVS